jgi:endonuclease/exonuclease/phosphatase (EEP) superfamily protein YafD
LLTKFPQNILQLIFIAATLWATSDLIFDLEYSWILFLYRALAPLLLVALILIFCTVHLSAKTKKLATTSSYKAAALLLFVLTLAPILKSLQFIPGNKTTNIDSAPVLTLINLNALGFRDLSHGIVSTIKENKPDIVTIQEVNPTLASALEDSFASTYRCRILKPAHGSWGMGTLAKEPCTERVIEQPGSWVGTPIVVQTSLPNGEPLLVANFHAIHPHAGIRDAYPEMAARDDLNLWNRLSQPIFDRERSFQFLIDTIKETKITRAIIAGDLNASMRNKIYSLIRRSGYSDAWLILHSAMSGGTWPAPDFPGGLGRGLGLGWLLRIDFIFHSETLTPSKLELLPENIGSDHRGMIARFAEVGGG